MLAEATQEIECLTGAYIPKGAKIGILLVENGLARISWMDENQTMHIAENVPPSSFKLLLQGEEQ